MTWENIGTIVKLMGIGPVSPIHRFPFSSVYNNKKMEVKLNAGIGSF